MRIHRYLELIGKLATGIWVAFVASVVLGVNWKFVVEDVFNSGRRIIDALLISLLLRTGVFLLARSTVGFLPLARAAGAVAATGIAPAAPWRRPARGRRGSVQSVIDEDEETGR